MFIVLLTCHKEFTVTVTVPTELAIAPSEPLPVLTVAPESMVPMLARPPVSRPPTVNADTLKIDAPLETCKFAGGTEIAHREQVETA